MRRFLPAATIAALAIGTASTLAAQTTDTLTFDEMREREVQRTEQTVDPAPGMEPAIEVEETIAPGEYELREVEEADDFDDFPVDTTGMEPKGADAETEWLMEPAPALESAPALEPETAPAPAEVAVPKG